MKIKISSLIILISGFIGQAHAQSSTSGSSTDKTYWKGAYEYIFSWGDVDDDKSSVDGNPVDGEPVVRFSAIFNPQEQLHIDFSRNFGLYTGIGMRNIGFINRFNVDTIGEVTVKQRQYTLGVPLALKVGNLKDNFYLAFGAELELFWNYKQKVFYNNDKDKFSEWFSDNSELLNPSLFAEVNFKYGQFIRFRYYLNDFLKENKNGVDIEPLNRKFNYDFAPSQLMYISIGTALNWNEYKKVAPKSSGSRASIY